VTEVPKGRAPSDLAPRIVQRLTPLRRHGGGSWILCRSLTVGLNIAARQCRIVALGPFGARGAPIQHVVAPTSPGDQNHLGEEQRLHLRDTGGTGPNEGLNVLQIGPTAVERYGQ